jgi:succinate dehydrogenase / fumarate reductase cytochrome b subunit
MLHRLSGIGLVVYLYLHLLVLNQLRQGAQGWDRFVKLASSPLFLLLDAILLFGLLMHGLNGFRLVLVGTGIRIQWQKPLFWISLVLSVGLTFVGMLWMFTR